MLSDIIPQPPLIIPRNPVKRTLHVILITSPADIRTRGASNRRVTHTASRTLTPLFLLEPASFAPRACCISIGQRRIDQGGISSCRCDTKV